MDLGSSNSFKLANGTILNGKKIHKNAEYELNEESVICFGDLKDMFKLLPNP